MATEVWFWVGLLLVTLAHDQLRDTLALGRSRCSWPYLLGVGVGAFGIAIIRWSRGC